MNIKLKINHVEGFEGVVTVATDSNGVPLEQFWRKRLADSATDNCVQIVTTKAKKRASK